MKRVAAIALVGLGAVAVLSAVGLLVCDAIRGSALSGIVVSFLAIGALGNGVIWAVDVLRSDAR